MNGYKGIMAPIAKSTNDAIAASQADPPNSSLSIPNSSVIIASIAVSWFSNALSANF
ncbi:hypothetical protein D3C80_1810980 [compost metagenome]